MAENSVLSSDSRTTLMVTPGFSVTDFSYRKGVRGGLSQHGEDEEQGDGQPGQGRAQSDDVPHRFSTYSSGMVVHRAMSSRVQRSSVPYGLSLSKVSFDSAMVSRSVFRLTCSG